MQKTPKISKGLIETSLKKNEEERRKGGPLGMGKGAKPKIMSSGRLTGT